MATKADLQYLEKLSCFALDAELIKSLESIISVLSSLTKIDCPPMILEKLPASYLRPDIAQPKDVHDVMSNAAQQAWNMFVVPKIIDTKE